MTPQELETLRQSLASAGATPEQIESVLAQYTVEEQPAPVIAPQAGSVSLGTPQGQEAFLTGEAPTGTPTMNFEGDPLAEAAAKQQDPTKAEGLANVPAGLVPQGQVNDALAQARAAQESILMDRAALLQQQADEESRERAQIENQFRDIERTRETQQLEALQRERTALAQYEAEVDNLLSRPMSADRLFGEGASGAAQFAAILGPAIGSMIQFNNAVNFPGTQTPNTAMRMINEAIERDVRTQQLQFQQAQQGIASRQNIFSMARQLGMDEATAADVARLRLKESAIRQLTAMGRRHMAPHAAAQLEQMGLNMRSQLLQQRALLSQVAVDQRQQQVRGGQGIPSQDACFNILPGRERDYRGAKASELTRRTEFARGARNTLSTVRTMIALLESGAGLSASAGISDSLLTAAGGRYVSLLNTALNAYRQMTGAGALDTGAISVFNSMLGGNPSRMFARENAQRRSVTLSTLRGLERDLIRQIRQDGQTFGIVPDMTGSCFAADNVDEFREAETTPNPENGPPLDGETLQSFAPQTPPGEFPEDITD